MENILLSKHFHLSELIASQTATRNNIDNTPPEDIIEKLKVTCSHVLEPVRNTFGAFTPNSGFRCLTLNRLLGSKDTSQHTKGEAVDMEIPSMSNHDLAVWCKNNLDFDQLIMEFTSDNDPHAGWVHCSYVSAEKNRHQTLTITHAGTYYGGF